MKKGLLTLTVAILASMFAFAAQAQSDPDPKKPADDAQKGVTVSASVKGGIIWARFTQATKAVNDDWDFIDTRMRPWFYIDNGSSKAVLGLEIDGHMGGGLNGQNLKYNTSYIPQNGDRTNIEINECYYETKVKAVPGLVVTAGLLEYKFPVYNFGDQNDQFKINYKMGSLLSASAIYMRWTEGDYQRNADNSHVWIADVTADLGIAKIRPAVFYIKSGELAPDEKYVTAPGSASANSKFAGKSGLIYGINAEAKVDVIGVSATFLYGSGKSKAFGAAAETKYSGYAGKLEVSANVAPATVKLFYNMISGDKDYTTATTEHKDWISMSFDTVGDGNTFILEDKGHSLMTDGKPSRMRVREADPWGYMVYGLQAEAKIADLKVKAIVASGMLAAAGKETATLMAMKKDLGYEFDLQFLYTLGTGTDLVVEGGYLLTGKAFETVNGSWTNRALIANGKTQTNNVSYIGLGTKYGF